MTITDTFNRADSATSLGTTSDGSATWSILSGGTGGISANQAYFPTITNSAFIAAVVAAGVADCTVQVTLVTAGISGLGYGLVFRAVDANNWWKVHVRPADGLLFLSKMNAGSETDTTFTPTFSAGDVLAVVLSGSSITVKQNGSTVATLTDSFLSTATQHGIFSQSTSYRLDDFSVTPAPPPPTPPRWRPVVRSRAVVRASVI